MNRSWRSGTRILIACFGFSLAAACRPTGSGSSGWPGSGERVFSTDMGPTLTLPPPPATATPTPLAGGTSEATAEPVTLWLDPALPFEIQLPPQIQRTESADSAKARLEPGEANPVSTWIYALVGPFHEVRDGVSAAEIVGKWRGQTAGRLAGVSILLTDSTLAAFSTAWGEPTPGSVQVVRVGELIDQTWERDSTWAIVPFEQLTPRWKVIEVDGQSPLRREFDASTYALKAAISLTGDQDAVEKVLSASGSNSDGHLIPTTNRDPGKLTTVAMTGVTALVRATAWTMEQMGITYPATDIGQWLREADVTHISNEVPFARNCPFPNPAQQGVVFCSDARYIELLEAVGTDVVELTGDHFHDWGAEAMLYTLSLYDERGWLTYGGGENYEDGRQPALLEHNGNRLAFIGCNGKGGSFARASATSPGSVACDLGWMRQTISDLTTQGYLVIATFQHQEYYSYAVPEAMAADFRAVADAGAVVVSGSQAHQPHGFEFGDNSLIHFGLGNLFFDQYDISTATRQGLIDRHIFYDGRHISTELLTIVFVDYARARPMNQSEREALLRSVFSASSW